MISHDGSNEPLIIVALRTGFKEATIFSIAEQSDAQRQNFVAMKAKEKRGENIGGKRVTHGRDSKEEERGDKMADDGPRDARENSPDPSDTVTTSFRDRHELSTSASHPHPAFGCFNYDALRAYYARPSMA